MRSQFRQFFQVLIVLGAGLGVYLLLVATRPTVATVETRRAVPLLSTLVLKAETVPVQLVAWGSIAALRHYPIKNRVAGEVDWLHPQFERGGTVRRNEVIARIDPKDYELRLENARAQENLRESALRRVHQEAENLEATRAIEARNYALAEKELARFEELLRRRTVSRQAYDQVLLASQKSRTALQNLENQIAVNRIQAQQEEANLRLARLAVEQAELDLSRTVLLSPLSGYFRERQADLHQFLPAGSSLGTIVDLEKLQLSVDLAADDFRALFPRDPDGSATASVELTDGDERFVARVARAAESLDPATRTRTVFLELEQKLSDGGTPSLLPGRFCRVHFQGPSLGGIFRIPFVACNDSRIQLIVDGRIMVSTVKILRNQGDELLVRGKELREGGRLVAVWNDALTEGAAAEDASQGTAKP